LLRVLKAAAGVAAVVALSLVLADYIAREELDEADEDGGCAHCDPRPATGSGNSFRDELLKPRGI
jgi:hypothetical protein